MAYSLARVRSGRKMWTTTAVCILKPTKEQPIFVIENCLSEESESRKKGCSGRDSSSLVSTFMQVCVGIDSYRVHKSKTKSALTSLKTEDSRQIEFRREARLSTKCRFFVSSVSPRLPIRTLFLRSMAGDKNKIQCFKVLKIDSGSLPKQKRVSFSSERQFSTRKIGC